MHSEKKPETKTKTWKVEIQGERERKRKFSHWVTPQMAIVAKVLPD